VTSNCSCDEIKTAPENIGKYTLSPSKRNREWASLPGIQYYFSQLLHNNSQCMSGQISITIRRNHRNTTMTWCLVDKYVWHVTLFIGVPLSSQNSERSCICLLGVSNVVSFLDLSLGFCSDSVVFFVFPTP
jgi:hypothetical protein